MLLALLCLIPHFNLSYLYPSSIFLIYIKYFKKIFFFVLNYNQLTNNPHLYSSKYTVLESAFNFITKFFTIMRKYFVQLFAMMMLFIGIETTKAQTATVWPTADVVTIAASQFSDTTQIFRATTANPNPPAGFKGWVSKPIASIDPAKVQNTHWDWTKDGTGSKGTLWKPSTGPTRPAIGSATAANGAAIFNSDFLDSDGTGNYEKGSSPSPHAAELWSPIIDATGKDGLVLTFNEYYRNFDGELTAVTWSEDGGATWKDTLKIQENIPLYRFYEINTPVAIKLKKNDTRRTDGSLVTGAPSKGTANFRIKFMFRGDYYFWIIDDVKLVTMDYNLRVNNDWYARPQHYSTPRAQVDTMSFMADISNQGAKTANNVKLTINIRDDKNVSVYTASTTYGSIKPDSTAENKVFGKWLPPTTGTGNLVYTGTYVVSSDNLDNFATNDTIIFPFQIADSLFSNENGAGIYATQPGSFPSNQHSWKIGNYFYFLNGSKSTATRIRGFVDTFSLVGVPLIGRLYEWKDLNGDEVVQLNERTEVGAAEMTIQKGSANPAPVDFLLENLQSTGVIKLKDKTAYLAMMELITTKAGVDMYAYWSEGIAHGPMKQVTETLGRPRYSTVISYDGTDATPWNTGTFRGDYPQQQLVPLVRLYTWPLKTDTKELLSENNKINLFPNPVSNQLNVAFDLEKTESAVLVRIIDMSGKILKERDFLDIKKETISLDVQDIPNGVYNIQVQTIGNYRTMRFVKAE
jgi:hypothetical protein